MKNNLSAELAINIDLVGADSEKFKLSTPISKAIEQIKSKVSEVNEKITEAEKRRKEEKEKKVITVSPAMEYILRKRKTAVQYYTTKFILDNTYFNKRKKITDQRIKSILCKDPTKRNIFELKALSSHFQNISFFK